MTMTEFDAGDARSAETTPKTGASREISEEMAEIRKDIGELAASVREYGGRQLGAAQQSLRGLPDEMLEDTRRSLADLRRRTSELERRIESNVREHPQAWALGALGVGLIVGYLGYTARRRTGE